MFVSSLRSLVALCSDTGDLCGDLEFDPYLGSFLAMLPALVLGLVGPEMFIKVLIVFAVEQTIEGRLYHLLVLGSQLISIRLPFLLS